MKKYLIVLLSALLLLPITGQTLDWVGTIGCHQPTTIYETKSDASGNTYLVGETYDFQIHFPSDSIFISSISSNPYTFVVKLGPNGDILWTKNIYETTANMDDGVSATTLTFDNSGNLIIGGFYQGGVDFDPGPSGAYNSSLGGKNGFILKLDVNGNFITVYTFAGYMSMIFELEVSSSNQIYALGNFNVYSDFDPSPSSHALTTDGTEQAFITKLGSNGEFLWAKKFGAPGSFSPVELGINSSHDIIIAGYIQNTCDLNPDTLISNDFVSNGSNDVAYSKLDSNGIYQFAYSFGDTGNDYLQDMEIDSSNNIILSGHYSLNPDFDPGINTYFQPANSLWDIFIMKINNAGNLIWCRQIGGEGDDYVGKTVIDNNNNIYLNGVSGNGIDLNPNPYLQNLLLNSIYHKFIIRLDPNGNLVWSRNFTSDSFMGPGQLSLDINGGIISSGQFNSFLELNPGGPTQIINSYYPTYNFSYYLLKLSQNSCSDLVLSLDTFSNANCLDTGIITASIGGGTSPYNFLWNTTPPNSSSTISPSHSGLYTASITDGIGCNRTASIIYVSPSATDSFDLSSNLTTTQFRPGFNTNIWLDAFNDGCIDTSSQLILVLDPLLNFLSASPSPDITIGDTLKWNIPNLSYNSLHFTPLLVINTDVTAVIGDSIKLELKIMPDNGDANVLNNYKDYAFPVVNGYDPNDKKVYPEGLCEAKFIEKDEDLDYTIRFQNTGNSSAYSIFIIDTFDIDLDLSTFKVLTTSHPYQIDILDPQVLKFRFDNIMLPDSGSNEPLSHGYIVYNVFPKQSLLDLTPITNKAYIYFDYNPPIITNTTNNTFVEDFTDCTIGINESIVPQLIKGYPNPTNSIINIESKSDLKNVTITVTDIHGKIIVLKDNLNGNNFQIDLSELNSGMYLVNVFNNNIISTQKVVKY